MYRYIKVYFHWHSLSQILYKRILKQIKFKKFLMIYIRDVNRAEIAGQARNFFCSARPGINVLQNL